MKERFYSHLVTAVIILLALVMLLYWQSSAKGRQPTNPPLAAWLPAKQQDRSKQLIINRLFCSG